MMHISVGVNFLCLSDLMGIMHCLVSLLRRFTVMYDNNLTFATLKVDPFSFA